MEKNNLKAWLYLLPAILFIGVFMIYPLIDVLIYSFELVACGANAASRAPRFYSVEILDPLHGPLLWYDCPPGA